MSLKRESVPGHAADVFGKSIAGTASHRSAERAAKSGRVERADSVLWNEASQPEASELVEEAAFDEDYQGRVVERKEVGVRFDVVARDEKRPVRIVVRLRGEARGTARGGVRDDGFVRGGILECERDAVAHGGEPRGGVRVRGSDGHGADVLRDDGRGRQRRGLGVAEQAADVLGRCEDGCGLRKERRDGREEKRECGGEKPRRPCFGACFHVVPSCCFGGGGRPATGR